MSDPQRAFAPPEPEAPASASCQNCGAALAGPFCAQCGQRDHPGAPTLRHVFAEFADDYLHLDSKLPKTLAALFTRPGYLTTEYVGGRRSRFVGPFKLYVLFSLIFFFCQAVIVPRRAPPPVLDDAHDKPIDLKKMEASGEGGPAQQIFNRLIGPRIDHQRPSEISRSLRRAMATYLPDGMLFLLPLVALLLKLLHWRRYYAEHFVLALHLHAVGYGVFTAMMLGTSQWLDLGLILALAGYGLLALKRVYRIGWPRAVGDWLLLTCVYPFALGLMVLLTVAVGMRLSA